MNVQPVSAAPPEAARKPKSEKRQRTAMICVRFLPSELYAVQEHAADAGYVSVSGWLRDLALRKRTRP